jgi:hypothetical protein
MGLHDAQDTPAVMQTTTDTPAVAQTTTGTPYVSQTTTTTLGDVSRLHDLLRSDTCEGSTTGFSLFHIAAIMNWPHLLVNVLRRRDRWLFVTVWFHCVCVWHHCVWPHLLVNVLRRRDRWLFVTVSVCLCVTVCECVWHHCVWHHCVCHHCVCGITVCGGITVSYTLLVDHHVPRVLLCFCFFVLTVC